MAASASFTVCVAQRKGFIETPWQAFASRDVAQHAPSRDHKLRESIRTAACLSRLLVAAIARRWDEFCGGWPTAPFGIAFMALS